eukprot:16427747-Heterocapsa_arctica.AAC.1
MRMARHSGRAARGTVAGTWWRCLRRSGSWRLTLDSKSARSSATSARHSTAFLFILCWKHVAVQVSHHA